MELVSQNIRVISCIKFSLISFAKRDTQSLKQCVDKWLHLADRHQVRFVAEGIESRKVAEWLHQRGIVWQQGYYWGKSVEL